MDELELPLNLIEARRTPLFDYESLPDALARSHRTTVWASLHVQSGSVRFTDLDRDPPRHEQLETGDSVAIAPLAEHRVDPSTDATFFVQFYRQPGADLVPRHEPEPPPSARYRAAPWTHRGRDLDTPEEVFEMVTRHYADVVQDDVLSPYFTFAPGFMDWQALIGAVADYWNHVLLFAPGYEIDVIDHHHRVHSTGRPFTAQALDRWLHIFHDTVDGGWKGPNADVAKKRATGTAWAMAQRVLGKGVWRPAEHR